jgi:hypothetical protein
MPRKWAFSFIEFIAIVVNHYVLEMFEKSLDSPVNTDLTTNIAEDVIYLNEGEIIRHAIA